MRTPSAGSGRRTVFRTGGRSKRVCPKTSGGKARISIESACQSCAAGRFLMYSTTAFGREEGEGLPEIVTMRAILESSFSMGKAPSLLTRDEASGGPVGGFSLPLLGFSGRLVGWCRWKRSEVRRVG